ncbi:MAG: YybH family protein [Bryobacteraceae bacterium]
MASLRLAVDRHLAAWNTRDPAAIVAFERNLVEFGRGSRKPDYWRDLSEQELRRRVQEALARRPSYEFTPKGLEVSVIGSTGLVWGLYNVNETRVDGSKRSFQGRFTATYVFTGGRWVAVLSHRSPMPEP